MSDDAGTVIPAPSAAQAGEKQTLTFKRVSGPSDAAVPYQAPDLPPYFVPREELFAIKRLLLGRPTASLAPITLHGPAGMGKTALAAALAHDADVLRAFPDGVLWASLGAGDDAQHAQAMWGRAFGNDLSRLPDAASRIAALRNLLRDARALLVMDDVSDVRQIEALNVGGPGCVRLITTANRLDEITHIFKTRRYAISRLREEEALALLTEWAGMLPDIYLPTVKEIVQRLFYSPLTLALVGGQARQGITWLRLLETLRESQGPLDTLNGDDPAVRRQALELILKMVLSRLGGVQARRAALLGAFLTNTSAPFSAEAAAACWQIEPQEAQATLEALVEAALVQRIDEHYYAIHEALHDPLCAAADPAELKAAEARLRTYYLELAEQTGADERIDAQLGQVVFAYHRTAEDDPSAAARFTDALMGYYERRGLWAAFAVLAERAAQKARDGGDVMREHAVLGDLGYAHTVLGAFAQARACFERSLQISQSLDDPAGEAAALNNIGATYEREGHYARALDYYQRSLALRERLGVREDIAEALNNVAGALYWLERWDEALVTFQRVLDLHTLLNDRQGQAQAWLNIGATYERMGRDHDAEQAYQRSLAIYANLGDAAGEAQALNNLGIIYLNAGDTERALTHFKRSLAIKERLGDRLGEAATLNNIALLYEKSEAFSLALEHYQRSHEILTMLEDPRAEIVQQSIETLRQRMQSK